jgi:hypothetical protein
VTHNDLKKGDKVLLTGGRLATVMDNRKGICRCIHVQERDGWYGDMGDVYAWEILAKLPADTDLATVQVITDSEVIELSKAHAKKQKAIEGINVRLRHQS